MNGLNEMCNAVKKNAEREEKKTDADTCSTDCNKTVTAELEFLTRVTAWTRKEQTSRTQVTQQLNIFNLNAKSLN
jgi:hypothetical protein